MVAKPPSVGLCLNASKAESRARAQRSARASARKYIFFNHGQCGTDDGMGHWGLFAIWNFPIFYCVCGPSPSSWPKPKFPVESVNIGRIIFFDIFFNSARKVRKNGIGPIKIREKKLVRDFRVAHVVFLFFPQMAYKMKRRGDKNASTAKLRLEFFLRYLDGTNSILPNFSSWVEKSPNFWDSAKNDGFQGKF